jgi:hypothetical protein
MRIAFATGLGGSAGAAAAAGAGTVAETGVAFAAGAGADAIAAGCALDVSLAAGAQQLLSDDLQPARKPASNNTAVAAVRLVNHPVENFEFCIRSFAVCGCAGLRFSKKCCVSCPVSARKKTWIFQRSNRRAASGAAADVRRRKISPLPERPPRYLGGYKRGGRVD